MVREDKSQIWLCPTCGSAAVDRSLVVGALSKCRVCKWEGPLTDLVAQQVQSSLLSQDILQLLAGDLRAALGEAAPKLIPALVRCRIISRDREEAVFIMNRIAQSVLRGVVEGAEELEKRRHAASKLFHRS